MALEDGESSPESPRQLAITSNNVGREQIGGPARRGNRLRSLFYYYYYSVVVTSISGSTNYFRLLSGCELSAASTLSSSLSLRLPLSNFAEQCPGGVENIKHYLSNIIIISSCLSISPFLPQSTYGISISPDATSLSNSTALAPL